jgi:hypothetical protein
MITISLCIYIYIVYINTSRQKHGDVDVIMKATRTVHPDAIQKVPLLLYVFAPCIVI